jgi:hypothetical protein
MTAVPSEDSCMSVDTGNSRLQREDWRRLEYPSETHKKIGNEKKNLIIYTGNFPRQNKNWVMMPLRLGRVREGNFKPIYKRSIDHRFLVTGL